MNIILQDYESVWHDVWPQNKCRSLWPILHGPVILPYNLNTIWYMNTILLDCESVGPDIWPKINIGRCELYFTVQWFCLISWRLFDIWTPYFGIISQYDPMFDLKINIGHFDLYFIVQWFYLALEDYLLHEHHTSGLRSALWHWLMGHEAKVTMTYISQSSDFALYLDDFWIYEHHTSGLWVSMTRHSTSK